MYAAEALMLTPTQRAPSMSLWGSCLIISLSFHVPGSLSSALITRYDGRPSDTFGMNEYLSPDGKPAPPLPRSPEALIWSIIQSEPLRTILINICVNLIIKIYVLFKVLNFKSK